MYYGKTRLNNRQVRVSPDAKLSSWRTDQRWTKIHGQKENKGWHHKSRGKGYQWLQTLCPCKGGRRLLSKLFCCVLTVRLDRPIIISKTAENVAVESCQKSTLNWISFWTEHFFIFKFKITCTSFIKIQNMTIGTNLFWR